MNLFCTLVKIGKNNNLESNFPLKTLNFLLGLSPMCFIASIFELIIQAFVFGKLCLKLSPID